VIRKDYLFAEKFQIIFIPYQLAFALFPPGSVREQKQAKSPSQTQIPQLFLTAAYFLA
jgi:hypothetical protein